MEASRTPLVPSSPPAVPAPPTPAFPTPALAAPTLPSERLAAPRSTSPTRSISSLAIAALALVVIAVGASAHRSRGASQSLLGRAFTPLPVDGTDDRAEILDPAPTTPPDPRRSLPPETRAYLARRHAPEMRFNAWFAMPDPSEAHRTEDFFPMSVDGFFKTIGLESSRDTFPREIEVVVRRSERDVPALRARAVMREPPAWGEGLLRDYPRGLPGDPPGAAPIYADVYPDPDAPSRTAYVELWSFYPSDVSDARIAKRWGEVGGHRSDWEHISLEVDISAGADRSRVRRGVYFGHEAALEVAAEDMELIDGTHPVVYVSQGKHASYPEAGEWRDYFRSEPFVRFDDVFHGNGARVQCWKGEVIDIARAARPRPEWLARSERWGGENERILGVPWCTSSLGPWFHSESNDRFLRITDSWSHMKATRRGLRLDRDLGITAPRVTQRAPERVW